MKYLAIVLALFVLTPVHSGDFTPVEGTVITESPFTVSWNSTASHQWVRALDQNNLVIFDSGLQSALNGSVQIPLPDYVTDVRVVFFYKVQANWTFTQRLFRVSVGGGASGSAGLDGSGGSGGSGGTSGSAGLGGSGGTSGSGEISGSNITLSKPISCSDSTGPRFENGYIDTAVREPIFDQGGAYLSCALSCPTGEILISTSCTAGYDVGLDPVTTDGVSLVTQLIMSDDHSRALCSADGLGQLYGTQNDVIVPTFSAGFDGGVQYVIRENTYNLALQAQGICMSVQ